ncbi:MAG TPA: MFS transporter [Desulfomonilaceae bacterium]|nr:MFS transporter [Desulfomonilaceae bacterium]HVN78037.1 MFS transporter [Terriglobia bacterium]
MGEQRFHYGWVVIFTGLLVTIGAHGFGRMSYTLILPAMKDALSFNYTQLGLLATGNFIGYLVMAIIGGFLAAKFGTRVVIALALVLMGITMILTGLAETFGFAFATRLMTGLGNGAAYVPAMALGSAWFAVERRGFATGIVSAGIGGGTMIAGLVVPGILAWYGSDGWRFAWYYLGGAVLLIAAVAGILLRSRPDEIGLKQVGAKESIGPTGAAKSAVAPLDWGRVYKMPQVWYLGTVYFMYGFSYIIYMTFFAAYLCKEMGLSSGEAGGLWALVGGLSIFCGVIWGGLSDKLGRAWGAALAYLVLGASYAVLALVQVKGGFYLSAVLFGITAWSIPTIMAATAGDYVGPRLAPAGLGFITLFFGVGQALGPWVGGRIADITQSFQGPFLVAFGVSLLGTILSLGLKRIHAED